MYVVGNYLNHEKLALPEKASTTTVSPTENCKSPRVCHLLIGQILRHSSKVSCRDKRPDLTRCRSINSRRKIRTRFTARDTRLSVATDLKIQFNSTLVTWTESQTYSVVQATCYQWCIEGKERGLSARTHAFP